MRVSSFALALLVALGSGVGGSRAASAQEGGAPLRFLVPLYVYPNTAGLARWDAVAGAAAEVPLGAIINPSDGPVPPEAPEYAEYSIGIEHLDSPHVVVLGYVRTCYLTSGARPDPLPEWCRELSQEEILDGIREDVLLYRDHYPGVEGIFFDEVSDDQEGVARYRQLCRQAKALRRNGDNAFGRVVLNPGTQIHQGYLATPDCDAAVVFEGGPSAWDARDFRPWVASVPSARIGALVYAVPTAAAMRRIIDEAQAENVGLVYVTHDGGDNPWDSIPSYWEQEVAYVAALNGSAVAPVVAAAEPGASGMLSIAPNPTSGPVTATLHLDAPAAVQVSVFDALGRRLAILAGGTFAPGLHHLTWTPPAPGLYVLRAAVGDAGHTQRVVVTR